MGRDLVMIRRPPRSSSITNLLLQQLENLSLTSPLSPHELQTISISPSQQILTTLQLIFQGIQLKYHLPSLYSRSFESFYSNNSSTTPLFKENSFRIMQFNLLAEGLSCPPGAMPPFPESQEKDGNYGGFDTNEYKDIIFDYSNCRKWRLLEEILRYSPDILAVEECDHFDDFFYPILQSIGYSVICYEIIVY